MEQWAQDTAFHENISTKSGVQKIVEKWRRFSGNICYELCVKGASGLVENT